jgi:hypothetical protein
MANQGPRSAQPVDVQDYFVTSSSWFNQLEASAPPELEVQVTEYRTGIESVTAQLQANGWDLSQAGSASHLVGVRDFLEFAIPLECNFTPSATPPTGHEACLAEYEEFIEQTPGSASLLAGDTTWQQLIVADANASLEGPEVHAAATCNLVAYLHLAYGDPVS